MKLILLALISLSMTACNDGGDAAAVPAVKAPNLIAPVTPDPTVIDPVVDPTPTPAATPAPSAQATTVTVYSVTQTMAPQGSFPSWKITFTGSCTVYLTKTYCWDDGIKTLHIPGIPSSTYTFWSVGHAAGVLNSTTCHGACDSDTMTQPTEVTVEVASLMQVFEYETGIAPSNVFSAGVATQASCTDDGTTLDCGSFQVTL